MFLHTVVVASKDAATVARFSHICICSNDMVSSTILQLHPSIQSPVHYGRSLIPGQAGFQCLSEMFVIAVQVPKGHSIYITSRFKS